MRRFVYWTAFASVAALGVFRFVQEPPGGRGIGLLWLLLLATAAGTALLALGFRAARQGLSVDLLFAVAVQLLVFEALAWMTALAALSSFPGVFGSWSAAGITITLTLWLLLSMALYALYTAWLTPMIHAAAGGMRLSPRRALAGAWRLWPRALLLLGLGSVSTLLLGVALLALVPSFRGSSPGLMTLFALPLIAWNILTAPLLLLGLGEGLSTAAAIRRTVSLAGTSWRRWGLPVLIHALLLGAITFVSVTYTESSTEVRPNSRHETPRGLWTHVAWRGAGQTSTTTTRTTSSSHFHGFWTGGYADESDWFEDVAEALDRSEPVALLFLAGLLLAVAGLAVKLHIAAALKSTNGASTPDTGSASRFPPTALLLPAILPLLGACGELLPSPGEQKARVEEAFHTPSEGRFHVRSRDPDRKSFTSLDVHVSDRVALLQRHFAREPDGDVVFRGYVVEYSVGSDARFRVEIADRQEGVVLEEGVQAGLRADADPRLLVLEQDVTQGQRLLLCLSMREGKGGWALTLVLFGGQGEAVAWPRSPTVIDGGELFDAGVEVETVIRGEHAPLPLSQGVVFGTPVGHLGYNAWLAADLDVRFPIIDWIQIDKQKHPSSSSSRGSSGRGWEREIHYDQEGLSIRGDGVEYVLTVDGNAVPDLTRWESPVWMVRGRFLPR